MSSWFSFLSERLRQIVRPGPSEKLTWSAKDMIAKVDPSDKEALWRILGQAEAGDHRESAQLDEISLPKDH